MENGERGKTMRIAIGMLINENGSFNPTVTTMNDYKNNILVYKDTLIEQLRSNRIYLGGFINSCEKKGWDMVPLIAATAIPSGPVSKEAFEYLKSELTDNIQMNVDEIDGVLLHLHGGMTVQGYDDGEGTILSEVRELVGDKPVCVVLDQHANVSELMCEKADVILGYNTQPHIDQFERESEAADIMEKMLAGEIKPVMYRTQPPFLTSGIRTDTDVYPMNKIMEKCYNYEKDPEVINVSPFTGFSPADKYEAGVSVVVTVDGNIAKAQKIAEEMAKELWDVKEDFFMETLTMEEIAEKAKKNKIRIAISDETDDPMSGGEGDGTYVLEKALNIGNLKMGISTIQDPQFVAKAFAAGEGNFVSATLGSWKNPVYGEPLFLENAKVLKLIKNRRIPVFQGDETSLQDPGRMVAVEKDQIVIVVTEKITCTENIDIFKIFDIDVSSFDFIYVKGLPYPMSLTFGDKFDEYILVDSLGAANIDMTKFDYKKCRRPIYPLEPNTVFRLK